MLKRWSSFYIAILLCFRLTSFAQQNSPAPPSPNAAELRGEIQRVEGALPKIIDRGAALFLEAKLYAQIGELPKALDLVKECVNRHQGFDPAGSPALRRLETFPEFRELVAQFVVVIPRYTRRASLTRSRKKTCFLKVWLTIREEKSFTWAVCTTERS